MCSVHARTSCTHLFYSHTTAEYTSAAAGDCDGHLFSATEHREHKRQLAKTAPRRTLARGAITRPVTVSVANQVSHRLTIAPRTESGQISREVQVPHHSLQTSKTVFVCIAQVTSQKPNCTRYITSIMFHAEQRSHKDATERRSLSLCQVLVHHSRHHSCRWQQVVSQQAHCFPNLWLART